MDELGKVGIVLGIIGAVVLAPIGFSMAPGDFVQKVAWAILAVIIGFVGLFSVPFLMLGLIVSLYHIIRVVLSWILLPTLRLGGILSLPGAVIGLLWGAASNGMSGVVKGLLTGICVAFTLSLGIVLFVVAIGGSTEDIHIGFLSLFASDSSETGSHEPPQYTGQ